MGRKGEMLDDAEKPSELSYNPHMPLSQAFCCHAS
jgi:hypothetical protein